MINLDDKKSEGIHWVSLFVDRNTAVYFDPFLIEYTPEKVFKKSQMNQLLTICLEYKIIRGRPRDFENRGGALCRPPWLASEKIFRFQMV